MAINYLFQHQSAVGQRCSGWQDLVSSAIIDRVVDDLGRKLVEVPVGF
ncbi:hypothetical protein ACNKHO_04035 [Shigella flexneri]